MNILFDDAVFSSSTCTLYQTSCLLHQSSNLCLCPNQATLHNSHQQRCFTLAGHVSTSAVAAAAAAGHANVMHAWVQNMVKVERAIWTARLHERLCDDLAHLTIEGPGNVLSLSELSTWAQVPALPFLLARQLCGTIALQMHAIHVCNPEFVDWVEQERLLLATLNMDEAVHATGT